MPKKNASVKGIKETTSPDLARKIDLRLEAKLSAEVSVLFVGVLVNTYLSLKIYIRSYHIELKVNLYVL